MSVEAFRAIDRNNKTIADFLPPFAPEDWTADGLCAAPELLQLSADSWYADPSTAEGIRAQMVCNTCPVRDACVAAARERGEQFGIWGEDFNDPALTRCVNGHWRTDETLRKRDGSCLVCARIALRAKRSKNKETVKELVAA